MFSEALLGGHALPEGPFDDLWGGVFSGGGGRWMGCSRGETCVHFRIVLKLAGGKVVKIGNAVTGGKLERVMNCTVALGSCLLKLLLSDPLDLDMTFVRRFYVSSVARLPLLRPRPIARQRQIPFVATVILASIANQYR